MRVRRAICGQPWQAARRAALPSSDDGPVRAHPPQLPSVAVLIAAVTVGRLPFAINGLAVVLFVREVTGSFAIAGLTTGMLALGSAIGAPFAGQARRPPRRRPGPAARRVHAAALLAIWALGVGAAPATCPRGGGVRRRDRAFHPPAPCSGRAGPSCCAMPSSCAAAYAFDSVMIEVSFVTGPLITAAVVAIAGPEIALAVSAGLVDRRRDAVPRGAAGRPRTNRAARRAPRGRSARCRSRRSG